MTIDLRRTVPLRIVDDLPDRDPATPGDAQPLVNGQGEPAGFIFACPGCGSQSHLPVGPRAGGPSWTVTAGDPRTGVGLSLSPSIHHTTALGGCGWHGFLTNGLLAPC